MIRYSSCPVCGNGQFVPVFSVKDFTVSKEKFLLQECADCSLRFTQDLPDASDIYRYYQSDSYISHSDTDKGFVNRLYHIARNRTLNNKRKLLCQETKLKTGSLLDIGAGTGSFIGHMEQAGWKVTGLEPDDNARQKAKAVNRVNLMDIGELFKLENDQFDAITLWHVLEHVHELHPYMDQLRKMLKPFGRIFIAVPNYTSDDARRYREFWAAYDVPRHLYHFSPISMKRLLTIHNLQLMQTKPMWYDSYYISLLSEQYKTGQSHPLRALINGTISNAKAMANAERCSSLIYIIGKPDQ